MFGAAAGCCGMDTSGTLTAGINHVCDAREVKYVRHISPGEERFRVRIILSLGIARESAEAEMQVKSFVEQIIRWFFRS